MEPLGNEPANRENRPQSGVSGETALLDSKKERNSILLEG